MSIIIEQEILRDYYSDVEFGYVGKNIETGETIYYIHMTPEGLKRGYEYLRRFNPFVRNIPPIEYYTMHCKYNTRYVPKDFTIETKLARKFIQEHIVYNKKMGYPTQMAEQNMQTLSLGQDPNVTLFGFVGYSGRYNPILNQLLITKMNKDISDLSSDEREKLEDTILHETGHLKAANIKIDFENNEIEIQQGFIRRKIKIQQVVTQEGDIFIKIGRIKENDKREQTLEEIFNELDCIEINPKYRCSYPQYGRMLDKITSGKLRKARYTIGLEEYYRIMYSIGSISKAKELLECMTESIFGCSGKDNSKIRAFELLEEYENQGKNIGTDSHYIDTI